MLVMSTASRRTKSRCVGIFLLVTTLIIICSPPTTVAVTRSRAVFEEEDENDVVGNIWKSSSVSPVDRGRLPPHDEYPRRYDHRTEFASSSIADSHFGWRGGISATLEDGNRIDDNSPASLVLETTHLHGLNNGRPSVSEGRNLRKRPSRDRAQRRQRQRGGRSGQEDKWYVDWTVSRCVQSCTPSSRNPNCAGMASWDNVQFDTAEYCCSITFFWLSFEDCTGPDYKPASSRADSNDDDMASLSSSSSSSGGGVMACPPEYSQSTGYRARDTVTIFTGPNTGRVYQCKDDALSLFCDQFAPNWSRVAPGGGSVHTLELGWTLVGDCQGKNPGSRGVDSSSSSNGGDGSGGGGGGDDDSGSTSGTSSGSGGNGGGGGGDDGSTGGTSSGQLPLEGSFAEDEDNEPSCWRSGTLCDSDAGRFACCTYCKHGVCA